MLSARKEEKRLVLHLSKETGLEIGVFCPAGGEAVRAGALCSSPGKSGWEFAKVRPGGRNG